MMRCLVSASVPVDTWFLSGVVARRSGASSPGLSQSAAVLTATSLAYQRGSRSPNRAELPAFDGPSGELAPVPLGGADLVQDDRGEVGVDLPVVPRQLAE